MSTTVQSGGGTSPAQGDAAGTHTIERAPVVRGPVLLASDGQLQGDVLAFATRLADERWQVPLQVVAVIEPVSAFGGMSSIMPSDDVVEADVRRTLQDTLGRDMRPVSGRTPAPTIAIRRGRVAHELAMAAREHDATVIVVGASPRRHRRRIISGVRATQVLRESSTPVLSLAAGVNRLPRRIVAAIDLGAASMRAARLAVRLAGDAGTLTLAYVRPLLTTVRSLSDVRATPAGARIEARLEACADELRAEAPAGVTVYTRITTGIVEDELLAFAEESEADLVAVGTRGPGLVERFFIGSVASTMLHHAPCSVLAAPAPPREALVAEGPAEERTWTAEPSEFASLLDDFSLRNAGRSVSVEVDDPEFGAQVQASGYVLRGVTWDRDAKSVAVMLDAPDNVKGHLSRTITGVDGLGILASDGKREGEQPRDRALEIRHGRGQTLLLLG
jgi:nucleotide-binding universal stress UspA family protein